MKQILFTVFCLFTAVIATAVMAQEKAPLIPTVGGTIFANYSYKTTGSDSNKFDFERVYLNVKAPLGDDFKAQITTDIYRRTTAGYYSGLVLRMKFAFLEYAVMPELAIRAGMIPMPWNGLEESIWKYRFVSQVSSDKYGYIKTADIGVSALYALPNKLGEVGAYMINGDGYDNAETNRFKDYALRATLTPFSSNEDLKTLTVGGAAYLGATGGGGAANALKKNRFGGLVSYSYSVATVTASYLMKSGNPVHQDTVKNGNNLSVYGEVKSPFEELKKLAFFWRFDLDEPDADKAKDGSTFLIAGLSWKANDKVSIALDYQQVTAETAVFPQTNGAIKDVDARLFAHLLVNF